MKKSKAVLMGILGGSILLAFLLLLGTAGTPGGGAGLYILIVLIILTGIEVYRISCANQFYKKMLEIMEEKDNKN